MKDYNKYFVAMAMFLITACVTVNIYFPAAEVRKTAEDIVKDVRGQEKPTQKEKDINIPSPSSWLNVGSTAFAANELTVSNATIRQIKARIKRRYPSLSKFMSLGIVGEGANGLVVIRNYNGLNLRQKAEVKRLVGAENNDRMALYRAVAQSLNIPSSQIPRIQAIFAKEWQRTAPRGTFIEVSKGRWIRK